MKPFIQYPDGARSLQETLINFYTKPNSTPESVCEVEVDYYAGSDTTFYGPAHKRGFHEELYGIRELWGMRGIGMWRIRLNEAGKAILKEFEEFKQAE